jgi:hypothetical protein
MTKTPITTVISPLFLYSADQMSSRAYSHRRPSSPQVNTFCGLPNLLYILGLAGAINAVYTFALAFGDTQFYGTQCTTPTQKRCDPCPERATCYPCLDQSECGRFGNFTCADGTFPLKRICANRTGYLARPTPLDESEISELQKAIFDVVVKIENATIENVARAFEDSNGVERALEPDDIAALWVCDRDLYFIEDGVLIAKKVNPLNGWGLRYAILSLGASVLSFWILGKWFS